MDFAIENHGSIVQLFPLHDAATAWAEQHLPDDCPRLGQSWCVEHRFAPPIIDGIVADGLEVQADG